MHTHPEASRIWLCSLEFCWFLYLHTTAWFANTYVFTSLETDYLADARWLTIQRTQIWCPSGGFRTRQHLTNWGPKPGDSNHHGASVPTVPETILTHVASEIDSDRHGWLKTLNNSPRATHVLKLSSLGKNWPWATVYTGQCWWQILLCLGESIYVLHGWDIERLHFPNAVFLASPIRMWCSQLSTTSFNILKHPV